MRKLRIFLVELVLVAVLVGWLLMRAPDAFDPFMPWILTAIVLHLLYECFWQADSIRLWRKRFFPSRGWEIATFTVVGAVLCGLLWLGAKWSLDRFVGPYLHPASIAPLPVPKPPEAPPVVITQTATDSPCANNVAQAGSTVKCEAGKESHDKDNR